MCVFAFVCAFRKKYIHQIDGAYSQNNVQTRAKTSLLELQACSVTLTEQCLNYGKM